MPVPTNYAPVRFRSSREGFILLELLFVVAIIAMLAAISVPNFLEAQIRSKRADARQNMGILQDALEAYMLDADALPPNVVTEPLSIRRMFANTKALVPLTTPVAYLVHLPGDTFKLVKTRHRDPWGPDGKYWDEDEFYYEEEFAYDEASSDEEDLKKILPEKKTAEEVKPITFAYWRFGPEDPKPAPSTLVLFLSAGPNKKIDSDITSATCRLLPYDSTNGSRSAGDLFSLFPPR